MRVVIQRVNKANVTLNGKEYSSINKGLCVFFGIEKCADNDDLEWLVNKIVNLRIFDDGEGKMNLSVDDVGGEILLVSQFTLHASTKKGNRPSFIHAERPEMAKIMYQKCIQMLEANLNKPIKTGEFGGDMTVDLENNGPVTIIIDTELRW